jgi:hypothetical protein
MFEGFIAPNTQIVMVSPDVGESIFILNLGNREYVVSTQNCTVQI